MNSTATCQSGALCLFLWSFFALCMLGQVANQHQRSRKNMIFIKMGFTFWLDHLIVEHPNSYKTFLIFNLFICEMDPRLEPIGDSCENCARSYMIACLLAWRVHFTHVHFLSSKIFVHILKYFSDKSASCRDEPCCCFNFQKCRNLDTAGGLWIIKKASAIGNNFNVN